MSLRFILGRAGTGKTRHIIDNITEELAHRPVGPPIVLLVPEQATFQTEYALAASPELAGTMRLQVLSFRRLAFRVLAETGGGARIPIGELGKRMVLRRIMETEKGTLRVFGKTVGQSGMTDILARSIGEMKTYLINPAALTDAAGSLADSSVLLSDKLTDIAFLYTRLESELAGRYTDPDDYLTLLAQNFGQSHNFRNAEFWLDGFRDFTPQELAVLESILGVVPRLNLTLCLDAGLTAQNPGPEHIFYPTWKTYRHLSQVVLKNGAAAEPDVILMPDTPYRFAGAPQLAHLEKEFFNSPAKPAAGVLHPASVNLAAAAGKRAEVEACAREITMLARDKGYRWRDMAVVVRDLEPYHELISRIFRDYEIPHFIDRKHRVWHHPLVELIRSALETVIRNWSYEPVFRYLKTDLARVSREQVFSLENYVLAHGIRGSRWTDSQDWHYRRRYTLSEETEIDELEQAQLAEINAARCLAVRELADFAAGIGEVTAIRDYATSLYGLLNELKVPETLSRWRDEAEAGGFPDRAREHSQIWEAVINLLDEVVEAMGCERVTPEVFLSILEAGFETLSLGLIPPGLDQVLAGSLDRSRNPEVKALFILGVAEGVFPAKPADDGILSDTERERLAGCGITLAPGSRKKVFEEQFLAYTALTRASRYLWLSYPAADEDGRAVMPSQVIKNVSGLLPGLKPAFYPAEPAAGCDEESLSYISRPRPALGYLTARLREAKNGLPAASVWWELANWFMADGWQGRAGQILSSVFYHNRQFRLAGNTGQALYGRPLKASVSRIEKFTACPFAHFSQYGLKLKERPVFKLAAPDMGEFFHAALYSFATELHNRSADWGALSPEDCRALSSRVVEELAPRLQSEILLSTARLRYLTGKLKNTVDRAAMTLAVHARRSQFRPVGLEVSFGPDGEMPSYAIPLPDGGQLVLTGRIDRIDLAHGEKAAYLRVIDYKSSDYTLKPEDIYYGLRLQLLAYLHVAMAHYEGQLDKPVMPGGIFYFTVREPLVSTAGPISADKARHEVLTKLRMKGLLLADRELVGMMDSQLVSGSSELLPVGIASDGAFARWSAVAGEERFAALRKHLERVFADSGARILQGAVDVEPYRHKGATACRFCPFKPVCHFDVLVEGNSYRSLPSLPADSVWRTIGGMEDDNG